LAKVDDKKSFYTADKKNTKPQTALKIFSSSKMADGYLAHDVRLPLLKT
jgi:hypothetical protein